MDDSKPRKYDAAATRKRRSSILKSQRSARAPLSELEFNVATPPDQAKSRRVSFSRRTGVAEFEISEATTAWKNVYEEHNKSLESSANESRLKEAPRRVAHLGGRAAHFADDEADVVDTLDPAPPPRAELSELAAHTHNTIQLFRLDANPALRELTDNLDVDFSAVAPLSDDLAALRQDLVRDPRADNISEYSLDVDFNSTHFTLKADDDDMSITDTIRSPAVAASKTKSQVDWTADKENIVVNPYIAPKASDNFAVSNDCEDILVFDGKKCKFQSNLDLSDDEKPSKTVVYDDEAGDMSVTQAVARVVLPARDEVNITQPGRGGQRTVLLDDDMLVTRVVPAQILPSEVSDDRKPSRTIVYDDVADDMSVTQLVAGVELPAREEVIPHRADQKTILLDDDIAVTRVVPAQILQSEDLSNDRRKPSRTMIYDDAAADMSVTQAVAQFVLPAQVEVIARSCIDQKTALLDDDMAVMQSLPAQILPCEDKHEVDRVSEPNARRRRTVVFGKDDGDISVTQAVPCNIINTESSEIQPEHNKQGTMYDDMADMSITQAMPAGFIQEPQRRKTVVFNDDDGHISMTEAVPASALLAAGRRDSGIPGLDSKPEIAERRRTIVYNNEDADISITGVVTTNIHKVAKVTEPEHIGRRSTIDGAATISSPEKESNSYTDKRISVTQGSPSNIMNAESLEIIQPEPNKQATMYFEDIADMSVTQAVPADPIQEPQRRKTIVFDDDGHISMTEAVPAGALLAAGRRDSVVPELGKNPEKTDRRTIVFNNEDANISITGVVTANIQLVKATDPNKRSPEKVDSEIYSCVDSMRPQISPGSSPTISRNSANASFDAMFNAPKRNSLGGRPDASQRASILDALLDMSQASVEALALEYIPEVTTQATASETTITNTAPTSNTTITNGVPTPDSYETDDAEAVKKDNETKEDVSKLPLDVEGIPERPALEGSQPLPIEYKKDKHGIVCKLQHKLSELKDLLHFKEKTSPKKSHPKTRTHSRYTEDDKNSSVNTSVAPAESSVQLEDNLLAMNHSDVKSASPEHDKTAEQEKNKTLTINLSSGLSMHDKESSPKQERNLSLTFSYQNCEENGQEPEQKEQSQWTGQDDTRAILDALSGVYEDRPPCDKSRRSSAPDRKSMVISREDLMREISMAQAIMKTEMQQTEELSEGSSDDREDTPPRLSCEVVKTLRFEDDESIIEPRVLHKPALVKSPPRRASTVIPTYDVSDHVKELVHDLIKPMADVAPQCLPDFTRAEPSRGSQVDTLESSQIDLIPSRPVLIEPRRASCLRRSPEPVAHTEMQIDQSPRKPVNTEAAVIVFDHLNPLNNVLLPPAVETVVHKYNPRRSQDSLTPSLDSQAVQTEVQERSRSVDCGIVLVTSTVDRAISSEPSVRDTEANTSIVMKANRELLAASSSLTLVDDALGRSAFDVTVVPEPELRPRSPVRVIFKLDEPYSSVQLDSELTSCDGSSEHKPQKRGHRPSKGAEVTPKPAIKVQKVSNSKAVRRLRSLSPSQTASSEDSRSSAPGSTVAALWSCARSAAWSRAERADWRPELLHEPSSKNLACEEDPGVNVVARIDVLPFMGTWECEWESRAADTWSFRLLRGRLRLVVRLEHSACNTTRAAVRADTPVRRVLVEHASPDAGESPRLFTLRPAGRLEHSACNTTRAAVRADTPVRRVLVEHASPDAGESPRLFTLRPAGRLEHSACNTTRAAVRADTPVRRVLVEHASPDAGESPRLFTLRPAGRLEHSACNTTRAAVRADTPVRRVLVEHASPDAGESPRLFTLRPAGRLEHSACNTTRAAVRADTPVRRVLVEHASPDAGESPRLFTLRPAGRLEHSACNTTRAAVRADTPVRRVLVEHASPDAGESPRLFTLRPAGRLEHSACNTTRAAVRADTPVRRVLVEHASPDAGESPRLFTLRPAGRLEHSACNTTRAAVRADTPVRRVLVEHASPDAGESPRLFTLRPAGRLEHSACNTTRAAVRADTPVRRVLVEHASPDAGESPRLFTLRPAGRLEHSACNTTRAAVRADTPVRRVLVEHASPDAGESPRLFTLRPAGRLEHSACNTTRAAVRADTPVRRVLVEHASPDAGESPRLFTLRPAGRLEHSACNTTRAAVRADTPVRRVLVEHASPDAGESPRLFTLRPAGRLEHSACNTTRAAVRADTPVRRVLVEHASPDAGESPRLFTLRPAGRLEHSACNTTRAAVRADTPVRRVLVEHASPDAGESPRLFTLRPAGRLEHSACNTTRAAVRADTPVRRVLVEHASPDAGESPRLFTLRPAGRLEHSACNTTRAAVRADTPVRRVLVEHASPDAGESPRLFTLRPAGRLEHSACNTTRAAVRADTPVRRVLVEHASPDAGESPRLFTLRPAGRLEHSACNTTRAAVRADTPVRRVLVEHASPDAGESPRLFTLRPAGRLEHSACNTTRAAVRADTPVRRVLVEHASPDAGESPRLFTLRPAGRLEHSACNTTRAAVRADTPVRRVLVEHASPDAESEPVAALCLCLAAEALRQVAARGVARAGAVPGLLRRGAAVARVALRWGRTVRAARYELAFSLADDGLLSLKVANVPLRSVWEVRLRVELVSAARGVPWPRATDLHVSRVVADWTPQPAQLQALLDTVPEDWGHVPRTIWKIFKYLKNKRPEDDLLTA